jgi:hypothetical protein
MKLTLERKYLCDSYTIGKLYIDNVYFCDTLEDKVRDLPLTCPYTSNNQPCKCKQKVYGETAIPYGSYIITLEYSPSKKRLLPYLHDVPHFLGILIHRGNEPKDTLGCILIGENKVKGEVINSTKYEEKLVEMMQDAKYIKIEIIR